MLVPFRDDNHGLRFVVQPVAIYLSTSLYDILQQAKGLGGYENSCHSFQLELAARSCFLVMCFADLCTSFRQHWT